MEMDCPSHKLHAGGHQNQEFGQLKDKFGLPILLFVEH